MYNDKLNQIITLVEEIKEALAVKQEDRVVDKPKEIKPPLPKSDESPSSSPSNSITCKELGFKEDTDCTEQLLSFFENSKGFNKLVFDGNYWIKGGNYTIPDSIKSFEAINYSELSHGKDARYGLFRMDTEKDMANFYKLSFTDSNLFVKTPSDFSVKGLELGQAREIDESKITEKTGLNVGAFFKSEKVKKGIEIDKCKFTQKGGTGVFITQAPDWKFTNNYAGRQKYLVILANQSHNGLYENTKGEMGLRASNQIFGDFLKTYASKEGECENCIIRNNEFINTHRDGIDLTGGAKNWLVENNYFEASHAAIDAKLNYYKESDFEDIKSFDGLTIKDNTFVDSGIVFTLNWRLDKKIDNSYQFKNILCENNTFIPKAGSTKVAYSFKSTGGVTIKGDTYKAVEDPSTNTKFRSIRLLSGGDQFKKGWVPSNITFEDITLDDRGLASIQIKNIKNLKISFKELISSGQRSILADGGDNIIIEGNVTGIETNKVVLDRGASNLKINLKNK